MHAIHRHAMLASAIFVSAAAVPAAAQSRTFDVPEQRASSGIAALARQANIQIFAARRDTSGKRTNAVRGEMGVERALSLLLEGTGLVARRSSEQAYTIVAAEAGRPAADYGSNAAEAAADEAIIVTGSRIRGAESGGSPTMSLTRQDIQESGAASVQELMRKLPQNFGGGSSDIGAAVASTRGGNDLNLSNGSGINLRGLGNSSTLVLLNGQRLAPGGLGAFVDVSALPLSAIERVDIVPDGASAIYGSDAVGGVVNFVLRSDFRGAETTVRYASVTDGSLRQYSASQLFGAGDDDGSIMLVLDYNRKKPLFADQRDFAVGLTSGGRSYLSLDEERGSVLVDARRALGSDLALSVMAYANLRDSFTVNYNPAQRRETTAQGRARDAGGSAQIEWNLGSDWSLTGSQAYSYAKSRRDNLSPATLTLPVLATSVDVAQSIWTSALAAEGRLADLPGGAARLAVGAEHRREAFDSVRIGSGRRTSALRRNVSAAYAELFLPVVGAANAGSFGERLELTGAVRYEDHSDVGSSTNVKLGAVWAPIELLRFRGTYGTSFRAPYLGQFDTALAAGTVFPFPSPQGTTVTAIALNAPSPNLGPERARTWSAGFDVAPRDDSFRLSTTYFNIDYRDRIIVPRFSFNIFFDPLLADYISRPADPALIAEIQTYPVYIASAPIGTAQASFDGRATNAARTKVHGIDLMADKSFDVGGGKLGLGLNASYLLGFKVRNTPTSPVIDIVDTIFNPADLKAQASLRWSGGGFTFAAIANYVDSYTDNQIANTPRKVSSWTTFDLAASYSSSPGAGPFAGLTVRFNVQNLLDKDPPQITDLLGSFGNPGYDTENASPIGRVVGIELTKRW